MTPCSPKPCGWDHRTSQHQVLRNDLDGVNLGAVPEFTQLVGDPVGLRCLLVGERLCFSERL